ncbi:MAG: hypothetical protein LBS97_05990 [Treponema sp.]|jgi:thioredoxin-related protein|nr:hypothetical protein [Treponema sp.]
MKKTVKAAVLAAVFVLVFGCASKPAWISDYDAGQKLAEQKNLRIFLLFSADETDQINAGLKKIFDAKETQKTLKEYVLINIDFSESRYNAAEAAEDADEKTAEAAEKAQELLLRDSDVAQRYSVQGLPAAYILTKEGYVLASLELDPETATAAQFVELFAAQQPQIDSVYALLNKIESSAGPDKVLAINDLYEATEVQYRNLLSALFEPVPDLDPENKTGFLGKFMLQIAYHTAMSYITAGDIDSAVQEFLAAAESPALSPEEKQESLFTAAYFMANTGAGDIESVQAYLQQAYDAAPESENAPMIVEILGGFKAQQE